MYSFNKPTKSFIETNPLLLSTEWAEASGDERPWSRKATIKIFNNLEGYIKNENPDQSENKSG